MFLICSASRIWSFCLLFWCSNIVMLSVIINSNMLKQNLHHFCNRSSPGDGPKSGRSTRDTYNYGQYINQFLPNTIKVIWEFKRIQKKICRHKISIMFNEICINEEMLPKYTHTHMYIYIYIYIYWCVCVCACVLMYTHERTHTHTYIYIYILMICKRILCR